MVPYHHSPSARTDDRSRMSSQQEIKLVPTDESWQGGIMQLYRAASPTARDILGRMCPSAATTGVPPRISEDRSIDESGVDGIGLLYTQSRGVGDDVGTATRTDSDSGGFGGFFGGSVSLPSLSENDMCLFVQPTQEVADVIENLSTKTTSSSSSSLSSSPSSPLIALLNPQWKNVDDALDSASKSGGGDRRLRVLPRGEGIGVAPA